MRLWSLHPRYLDVRGLTALWREGLLAQKVLQGETRAYRSHPQLERFKAQPDPPAAAAAYLEAVLEEAARRGYSFDASKIGLRRAPEQIAVPKGQLLFEWQHLKHKLAQRDPARLAGLAAIVEPDPHPLFYVVEGGAAGWERGRI